MGKNRDRNRAAAAQDFWAAQVQPVVGGSALKDGVPITARPKEFRVEILLPKFIPLETRARFVKQMGLHRAASKSELDPVEGAERMIARAERAVEAGTEQISNVRAPHVGVSQFRPMFGNERNPRGAIPGVGSLDPFFLSLAGAKLVMAEVQAHENEDEDEDRPDRKIVLVFAPAQSARPALAGGVMRAVYDWLIDHDAFQGVTVWDNRADMKEGDEIGNIVVQGVLAHRDAELNYSLRFNEVWVGEAVPFVPRRRG